MRHLIFLGLILTLIGCKEPPKEDPLTCWISFYTEVPGAAIQYAKSCDAKDGMCPPPKWRDAGKVTPCKIRIERCIYHFRAYRMINGERKITGELFFVDCTDLDRFVEISETFVCPVCEKWHPLPHCVPMEKPDE